MTPRPTKIETENRSSYRTKTSSAANKNQITKISRPCKGKSEGQNQDAKHDFFFIEINKIITDSQRSPLSLPHMIIKIENN
jgi:hypothetical protein